jgi:hypothetical protein
MTNLNECEHGTVDYLVSLQTYLGKTASLGSWYENSNVDVVRLNLETTDATFISRLPPIATGRYERLLERNLFNFREDVVWTENSQRLVKSPMSIDLKSVYNEEIICLIPQRLIQSLVPKGVPSESMQSQRVITEYICACIARHVRIYTPVRCSEFVKDSFALSVPELMDDSIIVAWKC